MTERVPEFRHPLGETAFHNTAEERGAGDGSQLTFFGDPVHQLRLNNLQVGPRGPGGRTAFRSRSNSSVLTHPAQ